MREATSMSVNMTNAFRREFDAYLTCLAQTVQAVREEDWTAGSEPRQTPVHQACHCLCPIIGYMKLDVDCRHIDIRWKPPARYPTRREVLGLIRTVRAAAGRYVRDVVDRTLVGRELRHPPAFRMIYLLRHSIWHLCVLQEELRRRGYKPPEYSMRYRPRTAEGDGLRPAR